METRFRLRVYLLTVLILIGFGTLLTRLHKFQIEQQEKFQALVPGNRTVTVREPGIRGDITDRNHVQLAQNTPNFSISLDLDEIAKNYETLRRSNSLPESETAIKLSVKESQKPSIVDMVNETTMKQFKELGIAKNYNASALKTHYITHGGLVPFLYRSDLTYDDFARIAERNLEFPGVSLGTKPLRKYPYGALASHVLGYLKLWEKGDISASEKQYYDHYIGEEKGIAGIEATMDKHLRGPEGKKTILKDEKGRNIGILDYIKPGTGATVRLTIDAQIQFLLETTLRRAGRAAGVILDTRTGEVLALASVPDYDPNFFIPTISKAKFDEYQSIRSLSPLTNRATSPFEPGSTMKIPTAVCGSMNDLCNHIYSCEGFVPFGNHKIGCWIWNKHKGRHGSLKLPDAIKVSCNPYFIKMANVAGSKSMVQGFSLLGFGKKTGIELPQEHSGMLPGSREWQAARPKQSMTPALTGMMAIGQGDMMATPLQMAAMTAAIANQGIYYKPRIIKDVVSQDGETLIQDEPVVVKNLLEHNVKAVDLASIREGMRKAVNDLGGTAGKVKMDNLLIAAKTGTSQTTDNGEKSNNSWIISFAPFEQPKYAVVILVQAGASGGAVCGPLIHTVYQGLIALENGHSLPLHKQIEYKGHLNKIEAIEPAPDILAYTQPSETSPPKSLLTSSSTEDIGETGEEVSEILPASLLPTELIVSPQPSLSTETDSEGQIIPRAAPVQE